MKSKQRIESLSIAVSLLLILPGIFYSCESTPAGIEDFREVCFETEVLPIFQNSCATSNCHDAASAKEGYRLDTYDGIMRGIVAGDASKSKLYQAITSTGFERMPPSEPLSQEARMIINVWINQGAALTECTGIIDTTTNPVDTTSGWTNPYVCFERDILPLMQSSCGMTGCHDPITHREGYNLTTYEGILKGVEPGKPADSEIYKSIIAPDGEDRMPPSPYSRLAQAQIDSIYNWILCGALDEDCGDLCDTTNVTYSTHIASIISTSCTGCHSGAAPSGGVKLENYSDLVAAVNSGAVPDVLHGSNGYSLMPPAGALSVCSIAAVEKWIENGMPQ